jgi:hypothetical protein
MKLVFDLRLALRNLSKALIFTTAAVLSLALGANAAIFSLIDQLVLRLLAVRNPRNSSFIPYLGLPFAMNMTFVRPHLATFKTGIPYHPARGGRPRSQPAGLQRTHNREHHP